MLLPPKTSLEGHGASLKGEARHLYIEKATLVTDWGTDRKEPNTISRKNRAMPVAITWEESVCWPQKGWAHGGAGLGCTICMKTVEEIPRNSGLSFLTVILGQS